MNRELLEYARSLENRVGALERQERPVPVVAVYSTDAGQSIPHNAATIVDFEDQVVDTHSAVTTGAAWKFTAPLSGYYQVQVHLTFVSTTAWALIERAEIALYKAGAQYSVLDRATHWDTSAQTNFRTTRGGDVVQMAAGEHIDIRVTQDSGGALALFPTGVLNRVSIFRIH